MRTNVMQSNNGKDSCLTLRHNIIAKISAEDAFRICEKIVDCHFYKCNCSQIVKEFLMSNTYNYVIHTFTLFGKFLKILQPIVAGYNWIFDSSINKFIIQSDDMLSLIIIGFWLQHQYSSGHFLFEFYNKFYSILNDNLSLIKLKFVNNWFLFTIDLRVYTQTFQWLVRWEIPKSYVWSFRMSFQMHSSSLNYWNWHYPIVHEW